MLHTFPNGFRVIHGTPIASRVPVSCIHIICDVGSASEPDDLKGACHFIEHLCFKGTAHIRNIKSVFNKYDSVGAYFNAYTEKDYTVFVIKCEDTFVYECLEILSDLLLHSTFPVKTYEKEKRVVVEENRNDTNNFESICEEKLDVLLYPTRAHTSTTDISGNNIKDYSLPIDTMAFHATDTTPAQQHLSRDKVFAFYKSNYVPARMILSILSQIPQKSIVAHIKKNALFDGCGGKHNGVGHVSVSVPVNNVSIAPVPPPPTPPQVASVCSRQSLIAPVPPPLPQIHIEKKQGVNTVLLMIGFRTCPFDHPDKYALKMIEKMLSGGTMSGRMFSLLREDNGLTYRTEAYTEYYRSVGKFVISVETDADNFFINNTGTAGGDGNGHRKRTVGTTRTNNGVFPLLMNMIKEMYVGGIHKTELERIRGFIHGKMTMNAEKIENQCDYQGDEIYYRDKMVVPYENVYKHYIEPLTAKYINRAIRTYFVPSNIAISILCDEKNRTITERALLKYL